MEPDTSSSTAKTGLVVAIAVLATAVGVGAGVYAWQRMASQNKVADLQDQIEELKQQDVRDVDSSEKFSESNTQEISLDSPSVRFSKGDVSKGDCVDNLQARQDRKQFNVWLGRLTELYPRFRKIYDVGAYCHLSDGKQLISFSHFTTTDPNTGAQTVALFSENNELLKDVTHVFCPNLGDLLTPEFHNLSDNAVTLSCTGFDAGHTATVVFDLNLTTFEYTERDAGSEENLQSLRSLKVGDVVKGMTVTSVNDTEHRAALQKNGFSATEVRFEGQQTITGKYTYYDQVEDSAVYNPSHTVQFYATPSDQLPFGDVNYTSSKSGFVCFENEEFAKSSFGPVGSSGTATVVINNYRLFYEVSEGCSQAELVSVVQK